MCIRDRLEELLGRIPEYEVDESAAVRDRTEFIRGYVSLPITFEPVARSRA